MTRKNWKITNISNKQVKVAVATSSHAAPGVILQPEQFCISIDQMTAPIDAQKRRQLVEVEKDFDNSELNLDLATAYDESILDEKVEVVVETILDIAVKETEKYKESSLTKEDLGNIIW